MTVNVFKSKFTKNVPHYNYPLAGKLIFFYLSRYRVLVVMYVYVWGGYAILTSLHNYESKILSLQYLQSEPLSLAFISTNYRYFKS